MEDALPLFGLAAMLWGVGFVIHALGYWWFRGKQLERSNPPQVAGPTAAALESRLARIETAVEAVAVEVERIGEAHRFTARLRSEVVETEGDVPPAQRTHGRDRA